VTCQGGRIGFAHDATHPPPLRLQTRSAHPKTVLEHAEARPPPAGRRRVVSSAAVGSVVVTLAERPSFEVQTTRSRFSSCWAPNRRSGSHRVKKFIPVDRFATNVGHTCMTLSLLILFQSFIFIFTVVGLTFFRKAKHNLMWILSALPFVIDGGLLIRCYTRPETLPAATFTPMYEIVRAIATVLCVVAIALYMLTLGTHRVALPGWHQPRDKPSDLVTWGPYRRIRHPFYSSYVIFFAASLLLVPSLPVLFNCIYLFWIINLTATREDKGLGVTFGAAYEHYAAHTGRFFPRLRRLRPVRAEE
jgi:protein-S-isoprenylcysteine O-methyltransferase Ste14